MGSLILASLASGTPYTRPLFGLRGGNDGLGLFELRGGSEGSGGSDTALLENLQVLKKRLETLETRLKETPRSDDDVSKLTPVMADPETGDRVRVRRDVKRPRFDWGDGVSHDSVGRLTWFSGDRCTVDFPRHPEWNGVLNEMERVAPGRELPRVGDRVHVGRSVKEPEYGWGPTVTHDSIGEVVSLGFDPERSDAETCIVRFDGHANWTGRLSEMVLATPREEKSSSSGGGGGGGGGLSDSSRLPRLPFALSRGSASSDVGGPRPISLRAGWLLGASAMAVASSGALSGKDGAAPFRLSKSTDPARDGAASAPKRTAVLRAFFGMVLLWLAFSWSLGLMLGLVTAAAPSPALPPRHLASHRTTVPTRVLTTPTLPTHLFSLQGAALLDRPLHSLLDDALDTAMRLRRGLLRQPIPLDGAGAAGAAASAAVPPLLRAALLLPLRAPTVGIASVLLYVLCLRSTVPSVLDEMRKGFEIGFKQLRAANSAASSAQQEALLRAVSSGLKAIVGVLQAARAAALGIGALVLLGSWFEGAPPA